jgi:hypothetical protein
MSYYKNLTIAVEALGLDIDMDEVHLGTVQFYQEEYERKTGKEIGVVDAIREIYGKKGKK